MARGSREKRVSNSLIKKKKLLLNSFGLSKCCTLQLSIKIYVSTFKPIFDNWTEFIKYRGLLFSNVSM